MTKPLTQSDRKYLRKILDAEKIMRDPKKVCYFATARDKNDDWVSADSLEAKKWCLAGALDLTGANLTDDLYGQEMFDRQDLINFHDLTDAWDPSRNQGRKRGAISAMFLGFVRLFAEDVIRSRP